MLELIKTRYEKAQHRNRVKRIEKEMPLILRSFATLINSGLSFEKTIDRISKSNYKSAKDFDEIKKDIDNGESVQEALSKFARKNNSPMISKTISLLISNYINGENVLILKRIADEQSSIIQNQLKEYNEKLLLYSLLIIGVSAVLPAFAQGFLIIGSAFMDLNITSMQAFLLITVGFPMANVVIFWSCLSKRP